MTLLHHAWERARRRYLFAPHGAHRARLAELKRAAADLLRWETAR